MRKKLTLSFLPQWQSSNQLPLSRWGQLKQVLPPILTSHRGNPFGTGQRAQVARQRGAFHADLFGQDRVAQLAGAGDVRE